MEKRNEQIDQGSLREHEEKGLLYYFSILGIGFFTMSLQPMIMLILPLWALTLQASPMELGIIIASGSFLPTIFAISLGALVDKLGSKIVMVVGGIVIAVLAVLHIFLPFIAALILLRALYGQVHTMNWIAAQTYVSKLGNRTGKKSLTGIFSFSVNLGTFIGPLLLGVLWDFFDPWVAFTVLSLWAACLCIFSILLPREFKHASYNLKEISHSLLPKWSSYRQALSMMTLPPVLLVVIISFLRIAGISIHSSFYIVYLEGIEFPATLIAVLFSGLTLASIFSPLSVSFLLRWFSAGKLMYTSVLVALIALTITPIFTTLLPLLLLSLLAGFGIGLALPLMITLLSESVGLQYLGLVTGLRTTFNRFASLIIPFIFGIGVQKIGISMTFFLLGGLLVLGTGSIGFSKKINP